MRGIAIVIICVVAALIMLLLVTHLVIKKRTLRKLTEKYGKPSTRTYDERDFKNISMLFSLFPTNGKEPVDDITWNDIQMPILYSRMNHSVSHFGDGYLYRHLRTQQYDEREKLEKHIQYFDAYPEERLKLQYEFSKINPKVMKSQTAGQTIDNNYVAHLKGSDPIPKVSLIPSLIIMLLAILSLVSLAFIKNDIGAIAVIMLIILVFVGSITYSIEYIIGKKQSSILTFKSFCAGVNAGRHIAKLDPIIFKEELKQIIPALKKLQAKSLLIDFIVDICLMQSLSAGLPGLITIYFGLAGFAYQLAAKTVASCAKEALALYEGIGYIELCIGLGSYRKTLSYYCIPEFSENTQIKFTELYHPLLKKPVTNSKTINQKFIVTGANASGKSTFVKTLAINMITAQSINTCFAQEFCFKPVIVYTAMNLSDDIISGDSFYMAEIRRLKNFLDFLDKSFHHIFFVDEILKGTNTVERIAAASVILRKFAQYDCFFCLATHDIELTHILQHYYSNYHFEEKTTDTEIDYDYKLYDGVTPGSNAIALLKVMKYDPAIVDKASKSAQYFRNNGEWEVMVKNG